MPAKTGILGALLAGAGLLLLASCGGPNTLSPERYSKGLVVVLGGAGGITPAPRQICRGLNAAGVPFAIEIYDWSSGSILIDQQNIERNRRVAARLARRLEAYKRLHPSQPVHLIGLSAGTGIIVFAMESMKGNWEVDTVLLLSSSINNRYDLTPTLRRVKRGVANFYSAADVAVLWIGVAVAGTVDRGHHLPAGIGGFRLPKDIQEENKKLYEKKLYQVGWQPGKIIQGHLGGHLGGTTAMFVKNKLAPIILGEAPGDDSQWQ
ncbi:MAG: hypothetical protein QGD94_03735 [Planctomycetia bacterium]|nr:hypothetical protein [Planctomycetia bacterium]